eukprot:TRINITY_DN40257_c0_g1_i1.p1 TRINITY_DN40257_c0_g1~~TRINITY_DN40257_c0_g1_i1.p1  ORF type:complete len:445 (-),score=51.26 TRINITY_DN40257_c0_g1_i1:263-1597(-)
MTTSRLTVCDVHGIPRGKLVPARNAATLLRKGMGAFTGMLNVNPRSLELYSLNNLDSLKYLEKGGNLIMHPDLRTFRNISWGGNAERRVAEVLCQLRNTQGQTIPFCPRSMALRQLERLERQGFTIMSGMELEFMLLDKNTHSPVYEGADFYSNLTLSERMDLLCGLETDLRRAGVNINDIHVEPACGQFEINYEPTWGILGADWPFIIRGELKESASKVGLSANFMGRPFAKDEMNRNHCGNGAHFNHSLWNLAGSKNMFRDESKPDKVSDLARHWIAGLIKHVNAMTALLCPTVNCYRRMHGPWAPSIPSWGVDDRYSTFRMKNFGKTSTYIENRIPSGLVNPYLALAVNIAAGLDGVLNQLTVPAQRNGVELSSMPSTLEESLQALEQDKVLREALGEDFVTWFCALKREGEIKMLPKSDMTKEDDSQAFADEMEMYGRYC